MISNCGSNENGTIKGGQPGDQTGGEYRVRTWYSRPWKCVLRHPDPVVRKEIARTSRAAAENDRVGYCQDHRITYYNALKAAAWEPADIRSNVEADCSSSTIANTIAAGYKTGNEALQNIDPTGYTGNMRETYDGAGFTVLTDQKYLTSDKYLLEGDILLNDGVHAAVNLTDGEKAAEEQIPEPEAREDPAAVIWNFLKACGLNDFAAAAVEGNLDAESALKPTNLQNTGNKKLNMTDEEYTDAVDAGTYDNFVRDGIGYGIAQWTYWTRKRGLLKAAISERRSIGDLDIQLAFLWKELTGYTNVIKVLKAAKTVREASDVILKEFERPADQGEAEQERRAALGMAFYNRFAAGAGSGQEAPDKGQTEPEKRPDLAVVYVVGRNYVTLVRVNVRTGPGTGYRIKGYNELTADGKKHCSAKNGTLDVGTTVTCKEVKAVGSDIWIRTPSGWLAAYYGDKLYIS